jgi:hypothetical protein
MAACTQLTDSTQRDSVAILYGTSKTSTFKDKSQASHGLISNDRGIRERRSDRTRVCELQHFVLEDLSNGGFDERESQRKMWNRSAYFTCSSFKTFPEFAGIFYMN